MAQENWWSSSPIAQDPAPRQPASTVIASPVKPAAAPKDPPESWTTLSPQQATAEGLDPSKVWQRSSRGGLKAVGAASGQGAPPAAKDKTRIATMESIVGQINRVQDLYDKGIRDESITNLFGALDSIGPEAGRFDTAGQGLADQGLAAFRVPGVGAQSDLEARQFAMANTPQSDNWDASIEEKLANMRRRVDANRAAMGLPPAQWTGVEGKRDDGVTPPAFGAGTTPPPSGGSDASPHATGGDGGPGLPPAPFMNADGQIAGNTPEVADTIATGDTRREDDPNLVAQGVRAEYLKRLARGDDAASLVEWAKSAGIDASAFPSIQAQAEFRAKHPEIAIDEYDTNQLDDRFIPISGGGQFINSVGASPAGAYVINAGDAATGFNLDSIAGAMGGNEEQVRRGIEATGAENPLASGLGTISGGVMTALLGEGALAKAGVQGLRASMGADTAYGALAGAGNADMTEGYSGTVADRVLGAAKGAGAGLMGSFVGTKIGQGATALARGTGNAELRALDDVAIPTTVGQRAGAQDNIVGNFVKGAEDRIAGLPVVGDIIQARRAEGVEAFNRAAFERALKPIGGTVGDATGEKAMNIADDLVSQAYTQALGGKVVKVDPQFGTDMTGAVMKVLDLPRVGDEVANNVAVILEPYMTGQQLTGEAMQQISRELRAMKSAYGADPLASRIGGAIDKVEDAIFDVFRRNAPEVVKDYERARTAARRMFIVRDAVLKAKNRNALFTPAQLGMAERTSMAGFEGKGAAARGEGPFHDLQRAAQNVLPSEVPDSGTAGRLVLPALLMGGGAGVDYAADTNGKALTIGALLAGAYTRAGQRLLTKSGRGVKSPTLRRMLESQATQQGLRVLPATGAVTAATQ